MPKTSLRKRRTLRNNSNSESKSHQASFFSSLYQILSDSSKSNIISWNEDGSAFIIHNQIEFVDKILSHYFDCEDFTEFARKLMAFGFTKIAQETYPLCFIHPEFYREQIKKTKRKRKEIDDRVLLQETIDKVATRISRLENIDKDRDWLKDECKRIQQKNDQLERLCSWAGSHYIENNASSLNNKDLFNNGSLQLIPLYAGQRGSFCGGKVKCMQQNQSKAYQKPMDPLSSFISPFSDLQLSNLYSLFDSTKSIIDPLKLSGMKLRLSRSQLKSWFPAIAEEKMKESEGPKEAAEAKAETRHNLVDDLD